MDYHCKNIIKLHNKIETYRFNIDLEDTLHSHIVIMRLTAKPLACVQA